MNLRSKKVYKVKDQSVLGICRIIENNKECLSEVHDRGVCQRHRMALERRGLLEHYGTKSQKIVHAFELKPHPQEGFCSVVEDGVGCDNPIDKRGLCAKHASRFYRDGSYEKFGAKPKQVYVEKSDYKIKKKCAKSECRIIENGVSCMDKVHSRGLCVRHRLVFDRHNLLEKFGTPSQLVSHDIKIKKKVNTGTCRIIDNGVECDRKVVNRGLCSMHRNRFYRHGTLSRYGLKPQR